MAWNGIGVLLNNRRTGLGFLRNNFVPIFRAYIEHNCFPAYLKTHLLILTLYAVPASKFFDGGT